MDTDMGERGTIQAAMLRRHDVDRMSRRKVLGPLGMLGLTAAGVAVLGRSRAPRTKASPSGGHQGHRGALLQDAGTPPPVPPPQPGLRPDGTRLWRVRASGGSEADQIEAMAFFPSEITINAGDAIFFDLAGLHTVTFLAGQEVPPVLIPAPELSEPVVTPVAGQPTLIVNPAVLFPSGGDTYDGTGLLNSGVGLLFEPGQFFAPTFAAPGTYDYLCTIHSKTMKGTVTVQETGAALPHEQADYDRMAEAQLATVLDQGRALIGQHDQAVAVRRADGTSRWEVSVGVGEGQAEVFRFLPDRLEIKAGDAVRWTNRALMDPHTVTFLGGTEPPEDTLVAPQDDGPPLFVQNTLTFFPFGGPVYNGTGFTSSGWLGAEPGPDPSIAIAYDVPETYELTFDTPGEYTYYCAYHGNATGEGMAGTIVVT
jgi:plastocyanin